MITFWWHLSAGKWCDYNLFFIQYNAIYNLMILFFRSVPIRSEPARSYYRWFYWLCTRNEKPLTSTQWQWQWHYWKYHCWTFAQFGWDGFHIDDDSIKTNSQPDIFICCNINFNRMVNTSHFSTQCRMYSYSCTHVNLTWVMKIKEEAKKKPWAGTTKNQLVWPFFVPFLLVSTGYCFVLFLH